MSKHKTYPMFASRDTLGQAGEYMKEIARTIEPQPMYVMTAVMVAYNTAVTLGEYEVADAIGRTINDSVDFVPELLDTVINAIDWVQ